MKELKGLQEVKVKVGDFDILVAAYEIWKESEGMSGYSLFADKWKGSYPFYDTKIATEDQMAVDKMFDKLFDFIKTRDAE